MAKRKRNFFKRFWDAFWRPEMLVLPGQISFFLFLSIIPTITLIGYACSYLKLSDSLIDTLITNTLGSNFSDVISPMITNSTITPAFFITLGVGYFIASNGMSSIIVASNTIYGIKDSGFFKRRFKAIIMELIIVILLLFVLIVPLLGDSIIEILHLFNLDAATTKSIVDVLRFLKGPFSWVVIFVFIKMIYTMAPDRAVPSYSVNGGAIFTTVGWILFTYLYSYYISHFANYSIFYGSLANIVILMVWVYFLSYVFVIGMAMNYHEQLEKTGIIDVQAVIEASANNAPVYPEEDKKEEPEAPKEVEEEKEVEVEIIKPVKKRNTKKKSK